MLNWLHPGARQQRGALSTAGLAIAIALLALAISIYVLTNCCKTSRPAPDGGGGPSAKVVRIRNHSGVSITEGMRVHGSASEDGQPEPARWPIVSSLPLIPDMNDPGPLGSPLPSADPGYMKVGDPAPPKAASWVLSCDLDDGTALHDVVCNTAGLPPTDGVHIVEVLATLESKGDGPGRKFYRFSFDILYWKQDLAGLWTAYPPLLNQTSPWVPAAGP